ncbi:hypothetical protein [Actinoplanes sp. NBRC 103695]|uniref:hypothetical protein n=1 Tax=Actinoplanes sp. NBRC 103695 TaxID=3032202 RepID=UPI0024A57D9A|nr:hypothetical protein [Actinoplanes sp. NBRC 103695]GLY93235.1 hypothetical protein Acsp02_04910 [Actinoplanes sp. NBRC 103695]
MVTPGHPGATRLGRADRAAVSLLAALLPAGFRDRQRDEWTGDLLALPLPDRRRYLVGAARTLPSLRRAAHRRAALDVIALPTGVLDTVARVLLAGLLWSMLSFYFFVPLRYYAFDIPGRLARGDSAMVVDPKDLWPLSDGIGPFFPLWFVLHLTAWGVVLGGAFLTVTVALPGLIATAISRRRHAAGLGVAALLTIAFAIVSTTIPLLTGAQDGGFSAAFLGLAAVTLAGLRTSLPRRTRILLAVAGLSTLVLPIWFGTSAGGSMLFWWYD